MTNEELVQEYQNGNMEVLDVLIQENEGLIHHFANKFKGFCPKASMEYDDLVQEGWIAFIDAVGKYDPSVTIQNDEPVCSEINEPIEHTSHLDNEEKQVLFVSYAGRAIQNRLFRAINNSIPRKKKTDFDTEVMVNSIDALLPGSEDASIADFIPDEKAAESYDDIIEKEYLKELRKDLLDLLDSVFGGDFTYKPYRGDFTGVDNVMALFNKLLNGVTAKEVLLLHYGLFGKSMTFAEIGKKFGMSGSRIGQIEFNGLSSIRKSPYGQYFARKYQDEQVQKLQEKKESINQMQSPEKVFFQMDTIDALLKQFA